MPDALVSTQDLAAHLGVTPQRVNQYAAAGMPKADRNQWDLHGCCRWVREYEHQTWIREHTKREDEKDYWTQNARLTRLKADMAEDNLAKLRGELVPLRQVMPMLERIFVSFKDNLLALPAKIAPLVTGRPPAEVRDLIDREIRERLTELTRARIRTVDLRGPGPVGDEDLPPGSSAAPHDTQPVGGRKKGHKSRGKPHGARKVAHRSR